MQIAPSVSDFVRAPVGRFVLGSSWLAWCYSTDLGGTIAWGSPSPADAEALTAAWEYDLALPASFDVVSDFSRIVAVDPLTFTRLIRYVVGRRADYDRRVRRHALVRAEGLSGAAVAGFNALIGPRFQWHVASALAEAFTWLDRDDSLVALTAVSALSPLTDSLSTRLASLLTGDPHLSIRAAARELGVSERSLQRKLAETGTSFRDEVARARLATAQRLLTASDDKIDAVARRVGLASASQLVRLFQRFVGESPGAWRSRQGRHRSSV